MNYYWALSKAKISKLYIVKNLPLLLTLLIAIVCSLYLQPVNAQPVFQDRTEKGLKDYYRNYFPIGVAVNLNCLSSREAILIRKEFNSITAENAMKMESIQPTQNNYNWKVADAIVGFAVKNKIKVRGHTLAWHNQTPAWMFKDDKGNEVSKTVLLARLKDYITTIVSRYKGKIYAWDVVNEAIDDNPANYLRNSPWYKICGEDFIIKAFEYAHAADPKAALYYNDYNSEQPEKLDRIYRLLEELVSRKIPITGVGLQGHWTLRSPSIPQIKTALDRYASLGLKIQITELDITVRSPLRGRAASHPALDSGYTPTMAKEQAQRYQEVFDIFRSYRKIITNVTFWNLSDSYSWLDTRQGGANGGAAATEKQTKAIIKAYPLLFDEQLQRKPAYWKVVEF